jgi:hypothetical protein
MFHSLSVDAGMDPISTAASSIAVVTLCFQVSRALHSTIETYKNCPDELVSLLTSTEGLLIQLRRLDVVKISLSGPPPSVSSRSLWGHMGNAMPEDGGRAEHARLEDTKIGRWQYLYATAGHSLARST